MDANPWVTALPRARQLAAWTLVAFAAPDGALAEAERLVVEEAGRQTGLHPLGRADSLDLGAVANHVRVPACQKDLIRWVTLVVDAKGGPTAEDRGALAYLTGRWGLPTPQWPVAGTPAEGPAPDPGSGAAPTPVAGCLRERSRAAAALAQGGGRPPLRWRLVAVMVVATPLLLALMVGTAITFAPPRGSGARVSRVVGRPLAEGVLTVGITVAITTLLLGPPFGAGVLLARLGDRPQREARWGGALLGVLGVPLAAVVAEALGPRIFAPPLVAASFVVGAPLGLFYATMGHFGAKAGDWLFHRRPL